jgi:antitoxin VapB
MATHIAKIFMNGGSQAVRLPKIFRLPGSAARVRRVGGGVLLEPMNIDAAHWFDKLDQCRTPPLLPNGRKQPRTPRRRIDL